MRIAIAASANMKGRENACMKTTPRLNASDADTRSLGVATLTKVLEMEYQATRTVANPRRATLTILILAT